MSTPADQLPADRAQDVSQATQRQAALDATRQASGAAREQALQPLEQKANTAISDVNGTQAPKPTPLPTFDEKPLVDPKQYQQLSMGLLGMALVAGVASKGNWMGATSALNGALKGYADGNQAEAEKHYKDYQTKFAAAKAKSDAEQKEFEQILQNKRLSINDMLTQVKLTAAKYGRDDIRMEAEQKSIDGIWKRVETMDSTLTRINDMDERQRKSLDAALQKKTDAAYTDQQSALLAAIADNNMTLPGGRSQQQIKATLDGLLKAHPDLDANGIAEGLKSGKLKLTAETSAAHTAGNQIGKVSLASNELDSFGDQVLEASKGLPRGSSLTLNGLLQSSESQLSDPKLLRLRTKLQALNNAYDQLAARGGTDADKRAHIASLFDQRLSDGAIQELVKSVKEEAAGARGAADRTIGEVSGSAIPGASGAAPKAPPAPAAAGPAKPPAVGAIEDGHKYIGGDPASPSSWERQ